MYIRIKYKHVLIIRFEILGRNEYLFIEFNRRSYEILCKYLCIGYLLVYLDINYSFIGAEDMKYLEWNLKVSLRLLFEIKKNSEN